MGSAIELVSTRVESSGGQARLVGAVRLASGEPREIYFSVAEELGGMLFDAADAFVPALLVPALAAGCDLTIRPPVSERLLGQLETIQDVLVRFHGFRRARVDARPRAGGEPGTVSATHFSGGVDSSHTLMRALRAPVGGAAPRYLLFFKGLEQPLGKLANVEASIAAVDSVARRTATTTLVVETNLRDVFNPNYELYYCGAALAAASLALAGGIGTVLVPSSQDYACLSPWGSHPILDPLWSTERQRLVFDGAGSRRVDKIAALVAEWPEALEWLRVCLTNSGGRSNCGRCRKCVRTMVALELLDALPRASLFPPRLTSEAWASLSQDHEDFVAELLDLGRRVAPGHPSTARIARTLSGMRRRAALRTLLEQTPVACSLLAAVRSLRSSR